MEYWYFQFEGVFRREHLKSQSEGVCSSVLLPATNESLAKACLIKALDREQIDLIQVDDSFQLILSDLDEKDEENLPWINWLEEVIAAKEPIFTEWQVF